MDWKADDPFVMHDEDDASRNTNLSTTMTGLCTSPTQWERHTRKERRLATPKCNLNHPAKMCKISDVASALSYQSRLHV